MKNIDLIVGIEDLLRTTDQDLWEVLNCLKSAGIVDVEILIKPHSTTPYEERFNALSEILKKNKNLTVDEAEQQGKLHPIYAQDTRNLGYSSYESYLDEECK